MQEVALTDQLVDQTAKRGTKPKPASQQLRFIKEGEVRVIGLAGELDWVALDTINVDPNYQRPISANHVKKIAKGFDPDLLGVVLLSEREDGGRYILDGQHRIEALRSMGQDQALIPAMIYRHLSAEREAHIFAELNRQRQNLQPAYAFRARLMAGDKEALRMKAIVERSGFHINYLKMIPGDAPGQWRPEGRIYCVGEMEKIMSSYQDHQMLDKVLAIMRDAWTSEALDLSANHMRGIAMFLYNFDDIFDRARLIEVLEKSSPTRLIQDTREKSSNITPAGICRVIIERYNYHLGRASRLPTKNLRKSPTS